MQLRGSITVTGQILSGFIGTSGPIDYCGFNISRLPSNSAKERNYPWKKKTQSRHKYV